MKCPQCHHVSDSKVECKVCGQAYDRATLETLEHVQYLLTWLNARASILGPQRHARLRDEASRQGQQLKKMLSPTPMREPEEIAPELAIMRATFVRARQWRQTGAISPDAANAVNKFLATQLDALTAELAGRPVEIEPPTPLQVSAFALKSLSAWRKSIPLRATDADLLEWHLQSERETQLEELREDLALTQAAHTHVQRWADATGVCPRPTADLQRYLLARCNSLKTELVDDVKEIQTPSHLRLLDYAEAELPVWTTDIPLPAEEANALREHWSEQRDVLLHTLARRRSLVLAALKQAGAWSTATGVAGFPINSYLRQQADELGHELQGLSLAIEPPTPLQVIDYARECLSSWSAHTRLSQIEAEAVRGYLEKQRRAIVHQTAPAPAAAPAPPAALPAAVPPSAPPPKGPAVSLDWANWRDNAWNLIASGALLKGLLYLGAFMIMIASAVFAIRYWGQFPSHVQLAFIAAVPIAFYGNGFVLRKWFAAPLAGAVFSGIGALMVFVDLVVVYQFGGLAGVVDARLYWLAASVFCTTIYTLTAWKLPIEFFGYVTLAGFCSTILAVANLVRLPLEWQIAALNAAGIVIIWASARLYRSPKRWRELAQASWRLPHILFPVCQALVLFVPGEAWLGQMATFALAALGYAWLAFDPRSEEKWSAVLAQASVWSSVPAAGFALQAAALPLHWYATATALLAPAYALASRILTLQSTTKQGPKTSLHVRAFHLGLEWVGHGLILLSVLEGCSAIALDYVLAGCAALTLAALALALFAILYQRPAFVFGAGGLFIVPFSVTITHILEHQAVPEWGAWLMGAWAALALTYLILAALLRSRDSYPKWLVLWVLILTPLACLGLVGNWAVVGEDWSAGPTLVALSGVIFVYLAAAVLHDSDRHPAVSGYAHYLPKQAQAAIFVWPLGILLPLWLALLWQNSGSAWFWFGTLLAASGLAYVGLGQVLMRRKIAYRLPFHTCAYGLGVAGALVASGHPPALLTSLLLGVGILASLGAVYGRVAETALAALLFVFPFHIGLQLTPLPQDVYPLAYALLASLGYIPLGHFLERVGRRYAMPEYAVGYTLSALALAAVLATRFMPGAGGISWVGVVVPLIIAGSQIWGVYHFERKEFAWVTALTLAIAYGQLLAFVGAPSAYHAAAWVSLALVYLAIDRILARVAARPERPEREQIWFGALRFPLKMGVVALCALGLSLTLDPTIQLLRGGTTPPANVPPLLLAQGLAVALTILAARAYHSRWPLYIEPWLACVPATLFFIAYSERLHAEGMFVTPLSPAGYALIWTAVALVHLCVAAAVDRAPTRYAHGLYLGGYGLGLLALDFALLDETQLFWTLGLATVASVGSAWLVHTGRHHTWDELVNALFGRAPGTNRRLARGGFVWFSAWAFPVWSVLLLRRLGVTDSFQWLGLAVSGLLLLGLTQWIRRFERSYVWPLHSAAQFYTAAGLIIGAPLATRLVVGTLAGRVHLASDTPDASAVVLQGALGVAFYAISAWQRRSRFFAHVAAWLSIMAFTLAWVVHGPALEPARFAWVWMAWGALLLGIGFSLDGRRTRYAHGPYLAGYLLGLLALLWSAQDMHTALYTLAAAIVLALVSQVLVHIGRHRTFEDFLGFFWRIPGTVAERLTREVFLFFAVYGFPIWLTLLMLYQNVPLAQRGVTLAVIAPIYIACGMALRRVRSTYAWPFYSAGYALTAVGAMLTFHDQKLAICTLTLNAVVYAISAYIFRQPFWLVLSTTLVPIIGLLTLDYTHSLLAQWVAGWFMMLSFLYFAIGQWLDRRPGRILATISPFALPFYAPAYLLSAIALALASADRSLALLIYTSAVVLYAISAMAFRESLFVYPAVWLTTVPYYVLVTLTPLPSHWHGLGWLPLIVACIAAGRYALPTRRGGIRATRMFGAALTRPATPFFLLAYALTLLMVAASWDDQLVLTCAFAAAAAVYLASAWLFRRPAWLYPGLAAAHLSLATGAWLYFPEDAAHAIAVPFLALTWTVALVGLFFDHKQATRHRTGNWSFARHLTAPGWASPFLQFAAFDLILWLVVALWGADTTIVLGVSNALLLALFATVWVDAALVYAALGCAVLALASGARWAGLPFTAAMACTAAFGLGLYLLAWIVEGVTPRTKLRIGVFDAWPTPLKHAAVALTSLSVLATLPTVGTDTGATAAALAAAGALALTIAYRRRLPRLGYGGAALLLLAWLLALLAGEVHQPQLYAIPAGLYLVTIGVLERQREMRPFAGYIESFGLTVLLLTSFIQSIGPSGFPYFLLLLVEALLVILWGAVRRTRIPFFMGIGTSVLNVVAQMTVLLLAVQRASSQGDPLLLVVLIVLGVGLILCVLAVIVERQRAQLAARAQEWRVALDSWD